MNSVIDEYSDPFGTAVGWPLFRSSSQIGDEEEPDDAKLEVLHLLEGSLLGLTPGGARAEWMDQVKLRLQARTRDDFSREFPLCYLVNRRFRVGGKWNPEWAIIGEPRLYREMRGAPYQRIAQAAPWVGNLLQGTVLPYFKGLRMCLRGCYHTADRVRGYVGELRSQPAPFVMESDISQYDLNLSLEATDALDDVLSRRMKHPEAALSLLRSIRRSPIAFPSTWNAGAQKKAVVVTGPTMMPSGIKLTAEYGTLCNVAVTIAWQLERGWRTRAIIDYWLGDEGDGKTIWLMQGDDKAVIGPDLHKIAVQIGQETSLYPGIGVTTKVAVCDRFLQKHMYNGALTPVMGRMVQQRLSNEHAPESHAQFMMGVTSSLIGVNGYNGGLAEASDGMPRAESARLSQTAVAWQRRAVSLIAECMRDAAAPYEPALEFLDELAKPDPNTGKLDDAHKAAAAFLTEFLASEDEAKKASALSRLLLFYDRYKYSATVADFFDQIAASSEDWASAVREYENKKRAFAARAYTTLGLDKRQFMSIPEPPPSAAADAGETDNDD